MATVATVSATFVPVVVYPPKTPDASTLYLTEYEKLLAKFFTKEEIETLTGSKDPDNNIRFQDLRVILSAHLNRIKSLLRGNCPMSRFCGLNLLLPH